MKEYEPVYEALGFSVELTSICTGNTRLSLDVDQPSHWYGGPPAIVPMWSEPDFPTYWGSWLHQTYPERSLSYVECDVSDGYLVRERARTQTQLLMAVCFSEMVFDADITTELAEFARVVGVRDLQSILDIVIEFEGRRVGLLGLPEFREDPPLSCCKEKLELYRGAFPHEGRDMDIPGVLRDFISMEFMPRLLAEVAKRDAAPPWLRAGADQKRIARELLERGDVQGYWRCLNSTGWSYGDAREALSKLAQTVDDAVLSVLAEAWCSLDHETWGTGY